MTKRSKICYVDPGASDSIRKEVILCVLDVEEEGADEVGKDVGGTITALGQDGECK